MIPRTIQRGLAGFTVRCGRTLVYEYCGGPPSTQKRKRERRGGGENGFVPMPLSQMQLHARSLTTSVARFLNGLQPSTGLWARGWSPLNLKSNGRDAPDSYVSLILLPDKSRVTKKKTTVQKKTVNPEFNEKKLEAYVKNSASFMSRGEPIGKVWNGAAAVCVPLIAVGFLPGEFQARDFFLLRFSSRYTLTSPKRTSRKVLPSGQLNGAECLLARCLSCHQCRATAPLIMEPAHHSHKSSSLPYCTLTTTTEAPCQFWAKKHCKMQSHDRWMPQAGLNAAPVAESPKCSRVTVGGLPPRSKDLSWHEDPLPPPPLLPSFTARFQAHLPLDGLFQCFLLSQAIQSSPAAPSSRTVCMLFAGRVCLLGVESPTAFHHAKPSLPSSSSRLYHASVLLALCASHSHCCNLLDGKKEAEELRQQPFDFQNALPTF
ncbi:Extended synaptotagmin-1, partial [Ophiophagus hannah]